MDTTLKDHILNILSNHEPYGMDGIALTLKERNIEFDDSHFIVVMEELRIKGIISIIIAPGGDILYILR